MPGARVNFTTNELARLIFAACLFLCHKISLYFKRIERAYKNRKTFAITSPIFVKKSNINGIPMIANNIVNALPKYVFAAVLP